MLNSPVDQPHTCVKSYPFKLSGERSEKIFRIEDDRVLKSEPAAAIGSNLSAKESALQRMNAFDVDTPFEPHYKEHRLTWTCAGRDRPSQNRVDMRVGVVGLPCGPVSCSPLVPRHYRVGGDVVIEVILVQVG